MGLFSRLLGVRDEPPAPEDPDDVVLRAMRDAGADLARETETRFYLYFPTAGHAHSAANVASREGYLTEVREPPEGYDTWLCLVTQQMTPSRDAIKAVRARLEELARSLDGEFDGWEAAVAR